MEPNERDKAISNAIWDDEADMADQIIAAYRAEIESRVKRECADRAEAWYKDDRNENIGSLRSAITGEEHE